MLDTPAPPRPATLNDVVAALHKLIDIVNAILVQDTALNDRAHTIIGQQDDMIALLTHIEKP